MNEQSKELVARLCYLSQDTIRESEPMRSLLAQAAARIEYLEREREQMSNGLRLALNFLEHPDVARVTESFAMRGSVLCAQICKHLGVKPVAACSDSALDAIERAP